MPSIHSAPGASIGGRYVLEQMLGTGSFGQVWAASDVKAFNRRVAVKLLLEQHLHDADVVMRFRREAQATAALMHPNVVTLIEFGEEGGVPYLVSELVGGESLRSVLDDRISRRELLAIEDVLVIFRQICAGVGAAHEAGIVHRDLKPENVMVQGQGLSSRIKVLDFGIARMLAPDGISANRTETGKVMGSYRYMAPEQVVGDVQNISPRTDLFALSALLFELLSLHYAFDGDAVHEVIGKVLQGPRPRVIPLRPELPPLIDAFFERAFAQSPAQRFASVQELFDSAEEALLPGVPTGVIHYISNNPHTRSSSDPSPPTPSQPGPSLPEVPASSPSVHAHPLPAPGPKLLLLVIGLVAASLFAIGLYVKSVRKRIRLAHEASVRQRDGAPSTQRTGVMRSSVTLADPTAWVEIPGPTTPFRLGRSTNEGSSSFSPSAGITYNGSGFWIQRREVTWNEYETWAGSNPARIVQPPAWVPGESTQRASLPAVNVPWESAQAYCESLGGQLPSEQQWEYAAREPDGRLDPWPNAQAPESLNAFRGERGQLAAVGANANDRTPRGVVDLGANAREWTLSHFINDDGSLQGGAPEYYKALRGLPLRDSPVAQIPHAAILRNAGCTGPRCNAEDRLALEDVGFRCIVLPARNDSKGTN